MQAACRPRGGCAMPPDGQSDNRVTALTWLGNNRDRMTCVGLSASITMQNARRARALDAAWIASTSYPIAVSTVTRPAGAGFACTSGCLVLPMRKRQVGGLRHNGEIHGPLDLVARSLPRGHGDDGSDVRLCDWLREGVTMIVLTSLVVVFLFVYLLAALLRPEWF